MTVDLPLAIDSYIAAPVDDRVHHS